jgi:hypothetical protein
MNGQTSLGGGWGLPDSVEVDDYGNLGVYDERGEYDLEATKNRLAEQFADVDERLPDTCADYEREDAGPRRKGHAARYVWSGEIEKENGVVVTKREVTIFPRGPYLRDWRVGLWERTPEFATNEHNGTATWNHEDAPGLDDPGAAAATALAVMRGEVDP